MNFVTLTYALFLPIVVGGYWILPRRAGRWFLIVASLIFYGSWNPIYVPGFVVLLTANYLLGLLAAARPRLAIVLAVGIDLGLLAAFKYLDWLLGTAGLVWRWMIGRPLPWTPIGLILPLAISFVTFTMLAYVIDVGRGRAPERTWSRFALFVAFFPHLIAGPIMRAREFLPQVHRPRPFSITHLRLALPFLVSGFAKKVLGDNLAPYVQTTFAHTGSTSTIGLWLGVLAFAFQILFDFSGYTDLALGSAALLGFHLPRNFDWPYRSGSLQEFWRRWHMTLSRWLRDYLYIPLGGSRHGPLRTYLALSATMLLGGLWHGAGFTFIIWGAWHGFGLAIHRFWSRERGLHLPSLMGWLLTFIFVLMGWVFFRANTLSDALTFLKGMLIPQSGTEAVPGSVAVLLLGAVVFQWPPLTGWLRRALPRRSARRQLAYGLAVAAVLMLMPSTTPPFIYFQF